MAGCLVVIFVSTVNSFSFFTSSQMIHLRFRHQRKMTKDHHHLLTSWFMLDWWPLMVLMETLTLRLP
jgi:hypothetical protein